MLDCVSQIMSFTFKKEERLCSRRLIDQLYAEGHRLMAFPFSVQWMKVEGPCQALIVAPKRRFHHAVDRNRVRRLTRECYRLRKPTIYAFLEEQGVSTLIVNKKNLPNQKLTNKFLIFFNYLKIK